MSSLWIRKAIGENTYKFLVVYYWKLYDFAVIAPMGRRASRQIQNNKAFLHVDLHFGAGYGAILNEVAKLLAFEKATGTRLRIRVISKYYSQSKSDCALSRYFEPIEDSSFDHFPAYSKQTRVILPDLLATPETRPFYTFLNTIDEAHNMFFGRFRLKSSILLEAQEKFKILTQGKNRILGIHYRGSDKVDIGESIRVNAENFISHAKSVLAHHADIEALYITTDEQGFLDLARKEIKTHPVFSEDLKMQATHGLGLHTMPGDPVEKAKDAIMVMLMLSQCRYLLKTASFLSAWAKVINPELIVFLPKIRQSDTGYVFPDRQIYETAPAVPV